MALVLDQSVYAQQAVNTHTVTTPAFTTTTASEVLYVIVVSDGSAPVMAVTGAGLTWTNQIRNSVASRGGVEVWTATTSSILTAQTVTATSSVTTADMSIQLVTFTGANPTIPVGNSGKTTTTATACTINVTTANANSWVYAGCIDVTANNVATAGTNQTIINQFADTNDAQRHAHWRQNATTPTAGTVVTMNLTSFLTDSYNVVGFEINAAAVNIPHNLTLLGIGS